LLFLHVAPTQRSTLFPYTTLFRSRELFHDCVDDACVHRLDISGKNRGYMAITADEVFVKVPARRFERALARRPFVERMRVRALEDRKSTRLNSSHLGISYAVFCLK